MVSIERKTVIRLNRNELRAIQDIIQILEDDKSLDGCDMWEILYNGLGHENQESLNAYDYSLYVNE